MSEIPVVPRWEPNMEFSPPAPRERLERARDALQGHGFATEIVADATAAKAAVLALVPDGAEVHVALSETMRELGLSAEIDESGRYNAIRPQLKKLDRATQQRQMAKLATAPDYILGSVHAVTEDGQLVVGSGSGSQIAPYANGAGQVILVAGAQKLVRDLDEGLRRLREYSSPLEDARMKSVGYPGTRLAQILVISFARPGRFHLFLMEEPIGF